MDAYELDALIEELDADKSGTIDFEEFYSWYVPSRCEPHSNDDLGDF